MCFSNIDITLFAGLKRPLEFDSYDKSMWNDKCDYWYTDKCGNLNPNGYNLIVLQMNICGALSHQSELCELLLKMENKPSRVDIVLLSETHLT